MERHGNDAAQKTEYEISGAGRLHDDRVDDRHVGSGGWNRGLYGTDRPRRGRRFLEQAAQQFYGSGADRH